MSSYFSATYSDARAKFLSACLDVEATVRSYENPERGPAGESLFTDATWIGSDNAPNVVVVTSSTHGVEGFAGSAIQSERVERTTLPSTKKRRQAAH